MKMIIFLITLINILNANCIINLRVNNIDDRFNTEKKDIQQLLKEIKTILELQTNIKLEIENNNNNVLIDFIYIEPSELEKNLLKNKEKIESLNININNIKEEINIKNKEINKLQKILIIADKQNKLNNKMLNTYNKNLLFYNKLINTYNKYIVNYNLLIRNNEHFFRLSNNFEKILGTAFLKTNEDKSNILPEKIEIYNFKNKGELKVILTHEILHLIGVEHTNHTDDLMYPILSNKQIKNLELTKNDLKEIKKYCK